VSGAAQSLPLSIVATRRRGKSKTPWQISAASVSLIADAESGARSGPYSNDSNAPPTPHSSANLL
jgi:hypothetical protein